jgi:hypothetical protein
VWKLILRSGVNDFEVFVMLKFEDLKQSSARRQSTNSLIVRLGLALLIFGCTLVLSPEAGAQTASTAEPPAALPAISYTLGSTITFATHDQLAGYGFSFGPSDGHFGAIAAGGGNYTFYGTAGSSAVCPTALAPEGVFTFTGTLDDATGGSPCNELIAPAAAGVPNGWLFDSNYAGGGEVVRFSADGTKGSLMPFHGELWWKNLSNPPSYKCHVNGQTSEVNCFYSGLGLAYSTDDGKTFTVAGQILQPSEPLSTFQGGGTNMAVGYGSLVVADEKGKHLKNPPDSSGAYFYPFFNDLLQGAPGACASAICLGVARARYDDTVAAVLSGKPHRVAKLFHKYDASSAKPWDQPATSDTPDDTGTAGSYSPLWSDTPAADSEVIYDRTCHAYLAVYLGGGGFQVRASSDLLHWSEPIGPTYSEAGNDLYYPTLIGDMKDPTVGGPAPRVYVQSFPIGKFPNYDYATFESIPLMLSCN